MEELLNRAKVNSIYLGMFLNYLSNPIVQNSNITHNSKDAIHLELNWPKMKHNI